MAMTKRMSVALRAAPTASGAGRHHRRQPGKTSQSTIAASPDRAPAICQADRSLSLITVPPVENKNAAASANSLLDTAHAGCSE